MFFFVSHFSLSAILSSQRHAGTKAGSLLHRGCKSCSALAQEQTTELWELLCFITVIVWAFQHVCVQVLSVIYSHSKTLLQVKPQQQFSVTTAQTATPQVCRGTFMCSSRKALMAPRVQINKSVLLVRVIGVLGVAGVSVSVTHTATSNTDVFDAVVILQEVTQNTV